MILDTTVHTPKVKQQIIQKIGEPYNLLERIRKGGVGSKRMRIESSSEQFKPFFSKQQDTIYCSIELRKSGIAIHFKRYQTVYSWLIQNEALSWENDVSFTLRAENHSLTLKKDRNFKENKKFLETLLRVSLD